MDDPFFIEAFFDMVIKFFDNLASKSKSVWLRGFIYVVYGLVILFCLGSVILIAAATLYAGFTGQPTSYMVPLK